MTEHRIPLHLVRFACTMGGTPANKIGILGGDAVELASWYGRKTRIEVSSDEKERSTQGTTDPTL